jgi:TPR repeat protein
MKLFVSLAAGVALLLSVVAQPVRADESIKADLKDIYKGVYGLYEKAEKGNPRAAFLVAALHLNGIFVPFDAAKGTKFLEVAAEKGDPDALYYLGLHYQHGAYDYKVDKAKASDLINKAAQAGHRPAKIAQELLKMKK